MAMLEYGEAVFVDVILFMFVIMNSTLICAFCGSIYKYLYVGD